MAFLIRFILVSIIIYLLIRSFNNFFEEQNKSSREHNVQKEDNDKSKGVSKEIGEYVDYEEVE